MKKILADDAKQRTQVDFLPVIEGDPNDCRTIFTTLKECLRLSGDKATILTFDLPILKAVDIIEQMNLPIDIDSFLDLQATKDAVIMSGVAIFQHIYHAPDTALGMIRYNMFSRKEAAGPIKPETLPPMECAASQHSLCAYLKTQDWMLLQSMSLDPSNYGWTVGVHVLSPYRH